MNSTEEGHICRPPWTDFFYVYSSHHPKIKLEVAARWDTRQRVGGGREKRKNGKRKDLGGGGVFFFGEPKEGGSTKREKHKYGPCKLDPPFFFSYNLL